METAVVSNVFILALIAAFGLQFWLARRQIRYVGLHRDQVPAAFADKIPLAAHNKAADYTLTRTAFTMIELGFSAVLILVWTLGGGLDLLDHAWRAQGWGPLSTGTVVIVSVLLIGGLLDLPFTLYRTFWIEAHFGFNRTTPKLFVTDLIKQALIGALIGIPLLVFVLWLMQNMGSLWWLYVWAVWLGFNLLMFWLYPSVIAPMFNKFEPLTDAGLKARIESLLTRCGFTSQGIFVMDGSRRSAHGNAYFTGLGKNKRIVFFDTLIKSLQGEEVEAVLAHELGHFRRKHIPKRLASVAILSLIGLFILGTLMQWSPFFKGLGVSQPSQYIALILFLMVSPLFSIYLQPLFSFFSRQHEFEADEFAAQNSSAEELVRALVKMYEENASTLTPDPLYSAFHDSHPPAPVRVAHLQRLQHI